MAHKTTNILKANIFHNFKITEQLFGIAALAFAIKAEEAEFLFLLLSPE